MNTCWNLLLWIPVFAGMTKKASITFMDEILNATKSAEANDEKSTNN